MNILIIQENGRHDKNRNFRECFSLKRAFEYYGHDCLVWGLGHEKFSQIPDFEKFDIILNLENYDVINWVPDLKNTTKPLKLLWSIDSHCRGSEIFEKTFHEGRYNYLLHSTKDFVKEKHHVWFPNAFDNLLIKPLNIDKKIKFGFCGSISNRAEILKFLCDNFNLHLDIFIIGEDMVKAINSYYCHFNLNHSNDINYRSFETIGCGTMLLTNFNQQYEELGFENEKNCLIYKNINELIDYAKNLDFFNKTNISQNGQLLSLKHSYIERVKLIISIYENK